MAQRRTGPVLVAGAGGFLGGHLAGALIAQGHEVRAVERKPVDEWYQVHGSPRYRS